MEGIEGGSSRWKNLRERLGLKGISCCGATWGSSASNMNVREEEYNDENYHHAHQPHEQEEIESAGQFQEHNALDPVCVGQIPATSGMNLATALAVERHFRASAQEWDPTNSAVVPTTTTTPGTPLRISLLRLLEEGDSIVDGGQEEREEKESGDGMCCVCMGRKKGAAFIPCGHTFCRVCSRELWLNRGSCPLCNRAILETLDIF